MLKTILHSLTSVQKDGLLMNVRIGDKIFFRCVFFLIAYIIGDAGKKGDALAGRYGGYTIIA